LSKLATKQGKLFVISGPSGSGKTTLARGLLKDRTLKNKLAASVSFTTRPRRPGEKNGEDYFFISQKDFKQGLKEKKFLEWTKYLGYYYGTSRDFVQESLGEGRNMVLCLDVAGARQVKRIFPAETKTIFISSPVETLAQRIKQRCAKTKEEEIRKRTRLARREIAASGEYDYRIVNSKLDQSKKKIKEIIWRQLRTH
jgi:guanylate kinase